MLERFYPGEYVDSTYEIDFDRLYGDGYRGVIFDIDNTLVPHGAPADERACRSSAGVRAFCTFEGAGISLHAAVEQ